MDRIEFFFDPVCPWAWITSRWVTEVQSVRGVSVDWRFISLQVVNEQRGEGELPPSYVHGQAFGAGLLRVAAAARADGGNDAVAAVYTAVGEALHPGGVSERLWAGERVEELVLPSLAVAGLPAAWGDAFDDRSHDAVVRQETTEALSRTGDDVGTPIITWDPDRPGESSLFGPVINRIPRGDEAVRLWDAVATVARTPGLAELKRSLRGGPDFR